MPDDDTIAWTDEQREELARLLDYEQWPASDGVWLIHPGVPPRPERDDG
jgi:hypothetical protein